MPLVPLAQTFEKMLPPHLHPVPILAECLGHIPVGPRLPGQGAGVTSSAVALFLHTVQVNAVFLGRSSLSVWWGKSDSLATIVSCPLLHFSS